MAIRWPEISYREAENGMLEPMLEIPKQPEGSVGKYGGMRRQYLEEHRGATYAEMRVSGTLKRHLMDINEQAHRMLDEQIERMLASEPAPDKATDPLGWIQHMNNLKQRAEEIVLNDLIYT